MLRAQFDGGCVPNPNGFASCACLIKDDGLEVYRKSVFIGVGEGMTNNVAEYRGLMLILQWVASRNPDEIHITGDSQIVINRMNRPRGYGISPVGISAGIAMECKQLAWSLKTKLHFHWRRRDENDECDTMCNLEIKEEKASRRGLTGAGVLR